MKLYELILFSCMAFLVLAGDNLYFTLVLVHTGTVTPKFPVPEKSWRDWDEKGPDELTAMGMREQYLLGYELRRRYNSTLDQDSIIDQVYVRMIDHNCTIMSGQAFLRGFLRDNKATLNDAQLNKADPPIAVDSYFKQKIGSLVLPSGVGTLPFHTFYPHNNDVLDSCYCKNAHSKNLKTFNKTKEVQDILNKHLSDFTKFAREKYNQIVKFPEHVHFLEAVQSAIHQFKETSLDKETESRIYEFADALYFDARTVDKDSVKYQTSEAFNFIKQFIESNTVSNMKNFTRKQNRRIAFFFIEDLMMTSVLKRMEMKSKGILPAASILTFQVTGTNTKDLKVQVKLNDEEKIVSKNYTEFLNYMDGFVVKDKNSIRKYCNE
eukprot:TRINITY_DN5834_c0_g1_i3.p1 TRINITY_DN5834_c0_g1~~TRINITY_DN5834_c0_g1_i3.p1  ORF type:complete len:379 (-),score=108.64 TRINITY_DN5834_c0_g1_i3:60-1196(-)